MSTDTNKSHFIHSENIQNISSQCCFIKWYVLCSQSLRGVQLFVTPHTEACQAPLSMGFPRQEFWSRLPPPIPGDLPYPGIQLVSLASSTLHADSLPLSYQGSPH